MNLLILDTEQTYGDIGYVIYSTNGERLIERQLVAEDVFAAAKVNQGLKQKFAAYEKLPTNICTKAPLEQCLTILSRDIQQYHPQILVAHNLSADRKVFNSWCIAGGLTNLNPFTLVGREFDSQELVKFLTINATSYSLEGFVRELSDEEFVQEHTGLADARLITEIFEALTEDEANFFLSDNYRFCKEYAKENKTIANMMGGAYGTGQLAESLWSAGFCEKHSVSKEGKFLATPRYTLNINGRSFFNRCYSFINNKHDMRKRYQRKLVVANAKNTVYENTSLATQMDAQTQALFHYQAQSVERLSMQAQELNKEIAEKKKQIIVLDMTLADMGKEQKQSIDDAKKRLDAIQVQASKDIAEAKVQAQSIINKANFTAGTTLQNAKNEAKREVENAQYIHKRLVSYGKLKAKAIHWGSWADRIFWPLLGLGLGIASFFLMNIYFLN